MQKDKELKVWRKAHLFTWQVYESPKLFPKKERYGLTTQLRRFASSIPANIAEDVAKGNRNLHIF